MKGKWACGLPRDAPSHRVYACGICGRPYWSIDAKQRHLDSEHQPFARHWRN